MFSFGFSFYWSKIGLHLQIYLLNLEICILLPRAPIKLFYFHANFTHCFLLKSLSDKKNNWSGDTSFQTLTFMTLFLGRIKGHWIYLTLSIFRSTGQQEGRYIRWCGSHSIFQCVVLNCRNKSNSLENNIFWNKQDASPFFAKPKHVNEYLYPSVSMTAQKSSDYL